MSNELTTLSRSLGSVVENSGPSLVRVEARRIPSSGIVWSAEGVLVTADHTLETEDEITVGLDDGGTTKATLVGRDPGTDVAVLRIAATGLRPPDWSGLDGVGVGHLVLALLRPGRTVRASLGIVTALGEETEWRTPAGGRLERYLQAEVAVQAGLSGGLLVGASGRCLGMNSTGLMRRLPLVVPASTLRRVVESVLTHGSVRRGYLGIASYPVPLPSALQKDLGQESGLIVITVQPDGPAATAGLLLGDVLLAIDGHATRQPGDLHGLLDEGRIGNQVTLRILRAGRTQDVGLTVGVRP